MYCPVCYETFGANNQPYSDLCGHLLCKRCIDRISDSYDPICPICRNEFITAHPVFLPDPDSQEEKEEEGDPGLTQSEKFEKVKDERDEMKRRLDRAVAAMTESLEVAKMAKDELVRVKDELAVIKMTRNREVAERETLDRNFRELNTDYLSMHSTLVAVRAERDAAERDVRVHTVPPHIPYGADKRHYFSVCRCGKLKDVNSFASACEGKTQYFSVCRSCKESRRNCGSSDDGSSGSSSKCPCGAPKRSFHRLCKGCHQGY